MTARERNIYPIGPARGAALLMLVFAVLALTPASAMAQCEDVGGAGDEYCETLPGPAGDRGAGEPSRGGGGGGGVPAATSRALENAGAGAVREVRSPRRGG